MTVLVIADMDDDLMNDLSSLAANNRMAVDAQARVLLRQAVPARDRSALVGWLDAVAAMTPPDVAQSDSLSLLREDRDR